MCARCGKAECGHSESSPARAPSAKLPLTSISIAAAWCYRPSHMSKGAVELRVGGQTYRVVATAEEADLHRLADVVDDRLRKLTAPGRALSPQSLLLAALALAH